MSNFTPGPWRALFDVRRDNWSIFGPSKQKFGSGAWIANTKCESVPSQHAANAHLISAAPELRNFLDNDQWQIIDRAIERYSAGEISDLHALGLITFGFLKLDADRQAAIAKAEGRS